MENRAAQERSIKLLAQEQICLTIQNSWKMHFVEILKYFLLSLLIHFIFILLTNSKTTIQLFSIFFFLVFCLFEILRRKTVYCLTNKRLIEIVDIGIYKREQYYNLSEFDKLKEIRWSKFGIPIGNGVEYIKSKSLLKNITLFAISTEEINKIFEIYETVVKPNQ